MHLELVPFKSMFKSPAICVCFHAIYRDSVRTIVRTNCPDKSLICIVQLSDPLYRMPGRTTIVRNLKGLHVRLFETEETSIVTASEDRGEVSDKQNVFAPRPE